LNVVADDGPEHAGVGVAKPRLIPPPPSLITRAVQITAIR
jgi:hypothetical protein